MHYQRMRIFRFCRYIFPTPNAIRVMNIKTLITHFKTSRVKLHAFNDVCKLNFKNISMILIQIIEDVMYTTYFQIKSFVFCKIDFKYFIIFAFCNKLFETVQRRLSVMFCGNFAIMHNRFLYVIKSVKTKFHK